MSELKACDQCGLEIDKAHRVENNESYCGTCYAREFKRLKCNTCGIFSRILRHEEKPICRPCKLNKPCIRCQRTGLGVSKITEHGPVCPSCSRYFLPLKVCDGCGESSQDVFRRKNIGDTKRLCTACTRKHHQRCPKCSRYGFLIDSVDSGCAICSLCFKHGERLCADCGKAYPAGLGLRCADCSWMKRYSRRISTTANLFKTTIFISLFRQYAEWLPSKVGQHKAWLVINKHAIFFVNSERTWGKIPGYSELVTEFTADGLRRMRLPVRWLRETQDLNVDEVIREQCSDERRIKGMLEMFAHSTFAEESLNAYEATLRVKRIAGKTSLRSIRLALTPATALLQIAVNRGELKPNQADVDTFLLEAPGQKAAVTGFCNFLRKRYDIKVTPKVANAGMMRRHRQKMSKELIELAFVADDSTGFLLRWVSLGLKYFHGYTGQLKTLKIDQVVHDPAGGFSVELDGEAYWLPHWKSR
jgi:hypothetical protein